MHEVTTRLNPQAEELNRTIRQVNPAAYNLLSAKGRAAYYPRTGILAQTAEAKGAEINATIGSALEDNGSPVHLQALAKRLDLPPDEAFPYSSAFGRPELRAKWREMMYAKNPSLQSVAVSEPIVSSALTHGLSMAGYLFLDEGDRVILPDLFWGNYRLAFELSYGARLQTYETFVDNERFNVEGLHAALTADAPGKRVVLLNYPNNPTGYTVTDDEARRIRDVLVDVADRGNDVLVLVDDAYFGLVYRDGVFQESMFALLAQAHERILAVKLDGPTKEDYVWGFRVGFVTFGAARNTPELYQALEFKLAAAIRGNVSNASNPGQSLLLRAYAEPGYAAEKRQKYEVLRRRYERIQDILASHAEYEEVMRPLPHNSGYFMCVRLVCADAEKVRRLLLERFKVGVIASNDYLRIAYSAVPFDKLGRLFDNIYQACKSVEGNS